MAKNGKGRRMAAVVESAVDLNPEANDLMIMAAPMVVGVTLEGVSKMLFHRYDCVAVEAKGKAGKGSAEKKTDNVESYTYRDGDGNLAIPANNLHACLAISAKSFQDPRSRRKSAHDLFKAGILVLPDLLTLSRPGGVPFDQWDFLDTQRVVVQQSAVSRTRPGVEAGWRLDADIRVLLPELISTQLLRQVLFNAGATVGLCDFRPRYGRFQVIRSEIVELDAVA